MKALIDTCVVIDVLQSREEFCVESQKVFLACANNLFIGYISANSITDIHYLMHHFTHDEKSTREILSKLFSLFSIADTNGIDCQKAVLSSVSDYEDAVMIETATRLELDCIVTRNTKDYVNATIPVYTPKQFIEKLYSEF